MKLALISATKVSLNPIDDAIAKSNTSIEAFHLLDSSLLPMLKSEGGITEKIIKRFEVLIEMAESANVDAILFTCSAFNKIVGILQPNYNVKIFRSDEAMLDLASHYKVVGLVSTVKETSIELSSYLKERNKDCNVVENYEDGLIYLLNDGRKKEHDEKVINLINQIKDKVDVIVLSQYSIAHLKNYIESDKPILTAPEVSVNRCIKYLTSKRY